MNKSIFTIVENVMLAPSVFQMRLCGETADLTAPGQFVNIELEGLYLRRPISVCDWDVESLTIIYKVVGSGTQRMSQMQAGQKLDLLTGLGNGYDLQCSGEQPLLIGGGVGIPPLYGLAVRLVQQGKKPKVILGFRNAGDIFLMDAFTALGLEVFCTTEDGSFGRKGLVTDAMQYLQYTYLYTCGPELMLKAVYEKSKTDGQFSFESRMGCGFGACMGCTCRTKYGDKRICKDGPVLRKEEIIW